MTLRKIVSFLCLLFLFSCIDDLDFKQTEDYSSKPSYSFSLANFNVPSTLFVAAAGTSDVRELSQNSNLGFFENRFIQNNLTKIDFEFAISNGINKKFIVEVVFFDGNSQFVDRLEDLEVEANSSETPFLRTISVEENPAIKNIVSVTVTVKLEDATTTVLPSDFGEFNFKSATTIYLDTRNN